MHDSISSDLLQSPRREEAAAALSHPAGTQVHKTSSAPVKTKPRGLFGKMMGFFARLFGGKRNNVAKAVPAALIASERKAVALAAQMEPPMAFKGDSASTLVTPMGAYAGKPVEQAMRKRAEQQFKNLDITSATMN